MIHFVTRATKHCLILCLILGAVSITGLRLFLAEIENFKQQLSTRLSTAFDTPVSIGFLRASLRGFKPEIVLKDINISNANPQQPGIYVRELYLGIDILDIIMHRQFITGQTVTVVGARFAVQRQPDNTISIVGLNPGQEDPLWLMQGSRYQILDSEISWLDIKNDRNELTFKQVNILLKNVPERDSHQINVQLKLPEALGQTLTISSQFSGDLFDRKNINGRVYVKGQSIQLSELMAEMGNKEFQIDSGIGDFELWSTWEHSSLSKLIAKVQIPQSTIRRADAEVLSVQQLSMLFNLQQQQKQQWQIEVEHLSMLQKGQISAHKNISALIHEDINNVVRTVSITASALELANLNRLALFFRLPDHQLRQVLGKLQIRGKIKDLMLFADWSQQRIAVYAAAEKVSVSPMDNFPGLKNFSGFINGTEQTGWLQLTTKDASIEFPNIFPDALKITQLRGELGWRHHSKTKTLEISSQMLVLDTPDIKTRNTLKLLIPVDYKNNFLDLQSEFFEGRDLARVKYYLPAKIMDKSVVDWLENFFVAGDIEQGKGLFYGNIQDFPFVSGNGIFEVLFEAKAAELAFDAAWPNLTRVDAGVMFFGERLEVTGHFGEVQGTEIQWADITIPKLGGSDYLLVAGETSGTIEQGLDFVLLSPLAERVQPVLENIAPNGQARVTVNLAVPLIATVDAKTNIAVHLDQAQVRVLPLDILVTQISGDLEISESGISTDNMIATALGYPISMKINHHDYQTRIEISGQSDLKHLQQQFPSPWWQYAQGKTAYEIQFSIPDGVQQAGKLLLTSNLKGLSLTMPLPDNLAKTEHQQRHLALQFDLSEARLMPVRLNYMNELKLAMNLNTELMEIDSANILYGMGGVDFLTQPEVNIRVNRQNLNLDTWLAFFESFNRHSNPAVTGKVSSAEVSIQQLVWQQKEQGKVDLQLQRDKNFWKIKSSNQFMQGNLSIPIASNNNGRIKLDLEFLDISALSRINMQNDSKTSFSPLQVPEIELNSRKVLWDSVNLGQLTFQALKQKHGLSIKTFDLIANDKKLSAKGSWTIDRGQQQSFLSGILDIDDLGGLLAELNVSHAIQGSEAFFDYQLYWLGAPHQVSIEKVTGEIRADLGQGHLIGVEPGLGRALGLLDFWQLDRRLQLDFSDLYAEGFAYNRIYGSFFLDEGQAITDDLTVEGLPAEIEIKGRIGLAAKDFDQIITVLPKSSVVMPIAGTIIGRVADYIKRSWTGEKHVGGFFNSSQYALTGTWSNVELTPLYENDGLLQKAWKGITDITDKSDE